MFLDLYQKLEDNVRANLSVYDLKEINLDFTLPWINIKFNKYNSHNSSSFSYGPQESTFLMFPGNVKHAVKKNESKQDRISIAFDINLK